MAAPEARAATLVADNTGDATDLAPGDAACATAGTACTLRAAVEEANALAGPDDVLVPAGTYVLALGELEVTSDTAFAGDGADLTVIDGNAAGRVLAISPGATVVVSGVTLRNGRLAHYGQGAGVHNAGSLTLDECAVSDNVLDGSFACGGGIYNDGILLVRRSEIPGNEITPASTGSGAGLLNAGTATLADTTVSGNGGGTFGGGVLHSGSAVTQLRSVTIAGNSAAGAGGIYCGLGSAFIRNSIIAGNTGGDCACTLVSEGYLLVEGGCGSITGDLTGVQTGVDPMLLPLGDYGGATRTHELDAGSPAADAANPAAPGSGGFACELLDQRGFSRPNGVGCDLGAAERNAPAPTPTPSPTTTPSPTLVPTATPPCPATPLAGCRQPVVSGRALFQLLDKSPNDRDRVEWKWIKGAVTPTATGFVYSDPSFGPEGAHKLVLKRGLVPGRATIVFIFKGRGAPLDDPVPPLLQPVRVQLRNTYGVC